MKKIIFSLVLMLGGAMPSMAQDLISKDSLIHNPMLWADVPDPDVIRVGDTYYLVSTTMHLMPGAWKVLRSSCS